MGWKDGAGGSTGRLLRSSRWVVLRSKLGQKGVEWRQHRQSILTSVPRDRKAQGPGRDSESRMAYGLGLGVHEGCGHSIPFQDLLQRLPEACGHRQSLQGLEAWGCH